MHAFVMMMSSVKVERFSSFPPYVSTPVEERERTDTYVVVTWRRLMLLIWRGEANAAGIVRSRELFDTWVAVKPGNAVFLVVVPADRTRGPDGHTVDAMARTASSPVSRCKGVATLIESEGFIAASVRALMMRIHSMARREDLPLVFGTATKAAKWAAALLDDPTIDSLSLASAIRHARGEGWTNLP
jgi:hypothetical protein